MLLEGHFRRGWPRARSPVWAALAVALTGCRGETISLGQGRTRAGAGGAFSAPRAIEGISSEDSVDDDPSLSEDLRLLYFNSKRAGGTGKEDIWSAERDAPERPWGEPRELVELNSTHRETGIALAADGLSIWFSSDRPGAVGGLDVYAATRRTRAEPWSDPRLVEELSSAADDLISAVADASRTLYLARRDGDDDDYDLFVAQRSDPSEPWGEPEALTSLNSDRAESDAFEFGAGLQLVLTRDEDLWLAARAARAEPFSLGEPLASLNSDADDRDGWVSQDFGYIVFSSNRGGHYALYEAQR